MAGKACLLLLINNDTMGNNGPYNKAGQEPPDGSEYWIPGSVNWTSFITSQRPPQPMGAKFLILRFLDILGISWGGYSIFSVINNTKEAILFIIMTIYAGVRIYFTIRFNQNRDRKERFEQRERERLNGKHLSK